MRFVLIALALTMTLTGCATAPRSGALALADVGVGATTQFRGQLTEISTMVSRAGATNAFEQTYAACTQSSIPEACVVVEETEALRVARQRLQIAIALRQKAVAEFGRAYEALRAEANYDASADLQGATKELVGSAGASLKLFDLSPSSAVARKAAAEFAPRVAGFFAARSQTQRLNAGSTRIGAAARMLAAALKAEKAVYVNISEDLATRESAVRTALLSSGAVPRLRALKPLAAALGLPLVSNIEAKLAQDAALRTATEAYDAEQTRARVGMYPSSYDTAYDALEALAAAHDRFEAKADLDLVAVTQFINELSAIVSVIRANQTTTPSTGN